MEATSNAAILAFRVRKALEELVNRVSLQSILLHYSGSLSGNEGLSVVHIDLNRQAPGAASRMIEEVGGC